MSRILIPVIFFIALFFSSLNHAQTKKEDSIRSKSKDSLKIRADLSLTGFWQGGNVETLIFRAKSEISFKPLNHVVYKTRNSYVYQEFGKVKADEDILSLNFLYFNPERKLYPLALAFVSTNFRREIDWRSLFGAGMTYEIFEKDKSYLRASLSSEYEQTRFNETNFNIPEYNGRDYINTWRATLWVSGKYHLFKGKLILSHESYYQPSLEEGNNYRYQGDFGIELPVWKFLNFKINYLHTYESIVIQGQARDDRFLTFGLTLKNY
jgi:hypothetical protein